MDEQSVRERAQAFCAALAAGDIDLAIEDLSVELRRNLGEVLGLLPLPASEAVVDSVEHTGSGYNVVIKLVGETEEVLILTRWKDRDDRPTIIEASHLSKTVVATPVDSEAGEGEGDDATGP